VKEDSEFDIHQVAAAWIRTPFVATVLKRRTRTSGGRSSDHKAASATEHAPALRRKTVPV
jgi:hypothetical protein